MSYHRLRGTPSGFHDKIAFCYIFRCLVAFPEDKFGTSQTSNARNTMRHHDEYEIFMVLACRRDQKDTVLIMMLMAIVQELRV